MRFAWLNLSAGFRLLSLFARQLNRVPGPSKAVQLMGDRETRMPKQYARAGPLHYVLGLCSLGWLVAVDRAIGAGRLVLAVGAFFQPPLGVIQEFLALGTQLIPWTEVVIVAIDSDHLCNGQPLSLKVFLFEIHS